MQQKKQRASIFNTYLLTYIFVAYFKTNNKDKIRNKNKRGRF